VVVEGMQRVIICGGVFEFEEGEAG
jgi:hypothetical protein